MEISNVSTGADGSLAATIDGIEWQAITQNSRYWPAIEEWAAAGGVIAPYVASPPSTEPADYPLQRYQFLAMLTIAGLSSLPATAIATITDPTAKIVAQAKYDAATVFYWSDPTTAAMIAAAVVSGAITQEQAVAYWMQAKGL